MVTEKTTAISRHFSFKRVLVYLALAAGLAMWFGTANKRPYVGEALPLAAAPPSGVGQEAQVTDRSRELLVLLGFSGGGTRAAALAYGVLQELADTDIIINSRQRRLLDEVDAISSVSGGSFTNAYFGLFGDRIFDDFKQVMLLRPIQSDLIKGLLTPTNWHDLASPYYGSNDLAASYYDEHIFEGKTFSAIDPTKAPLIIINASDIGTGERMVFTRHLLNLLCVDYDAYPISRAVAASSGVPGAASPIAIKNNAGNCGYKLPDWMLSAVEQPTSRVVAAKIKRSLNYMDSNKRPWLHLVDGGITDNLGLRQYYEFSHLSHGMEKFFEEYTGTQVNEVLIISVNAAVEHLLPWADLAKTPSERQTLGSMTHIQMRNYTSDTLHIIDKAYKDWEGSRSGDAAQAQFDFVEVAFSEIKDDKERAYLNELPTSLELSEEQVDRLISAGRQLLRESPSFNEFLSRYDSGTPGGH